MADRLRKLQVSSSKFSVKRANPHNPLIVIVKSRFCKYKIPGILLLLAFGIFCTPALAHRVLVYGSASGDTIRLESKLSSKTPVRQGQVQVMEINTGQVLLTGKTDDRGKFSFKIPAAAAAQKMDLKIVVTAGMGHQGEWLLQAANYLPGAKTAATVSSTAATPASPPAPAPPGVKSAADVQVLEEVVNKALERQLAPVNEKLAGLAVHQTSLSDIIGGLGYILGFFGLWAYFQSKRTRDS